MPQPFRNARGARPRPITYAALADLAEAIGAPGAAHFRAFAEAERENAAEELDRIHYQLALVPDAPESTRHDDTCWQRHAACLADRIMDL